MSVITTNPDDCETELHIDGQFIASWHEIVLDDDTRRIVCSMIDKAVTHGRSLQAADMRKALNL